MIWRGQEFEDGSAGPFLLGVFHMVAVTHQTLEYLTGSDFHDDSFTWLVIFAGCWQRVQQCCPPEWLPLVFTISPSELDFYMVAGCPQLDIPQNVPRKPGMDPHYGNKVHKYWSVLKRPHSSLYPQIIFITPLIKYAFSFPNFPLSLYTGAWGSGSESRSLSFKWALSFKSMWLHGFGFLIIVSIKLKILELRASCLLLTHPRYNAGIEIGRLW